MLATTARCVFAQIRYMAEDPVVAVFGIVTLQIGVLLTHLLVRMWPNITEKPLVPTAPRQRYALSWPPGGTGDEI